MSLTDLGKESIDSQKINLQENISEKSTFSDIITVFENNVVLKTKIPELEQIRDNLNNQNSHDVEKMLGLILNSSRQRKYDEVSGYLDDLYKMTTLYTQEKEELKDQSIKTKEDVKTDLGKIYEGAIGKVSEYGDKASIFVFGSDSFQKIKDVKIDGDLDSLDELISRLDKLKQVISSTNEFKKLSKIDQEIVIQNITALSNGIKEKQKIGLDFLNKKFDDLAIQVDKSGDTDVNIDLGDGNVITFPNKQEAFRFIHSLKSESEDQLQDFSKTFSEWFGDSLLNILNLGLEPLLIPYKITKWETVEDMDENFRNDAEWFTWTGDTIVGLISILASVNYTESLWRRAIVDNLAKMGLKKLPFVKGDLNEPLKIPDYSNNSTYYGDAIDVKLRDEYNQRIYAINQLEDQIKTITDPKKRIAQEKELNNIKTYLNINTDTFWLKALSLKNDYGIPMRSLIVIGNSPQGWPTGITVRDIATREFKSGYSGLKNQFNEGLDFAFNNTSVDIDNDGKIIVSGGTEISDNINSLKYYVDSLSISNNEKKLIKSRIDDYIKTLNNNPASLEVIKRNLLLIVREKYLPKSNIVQQINDKLKAKYPFLEKETRDLTFTEKWQKFYLEKVKKGVGYASPASLTSGDPMLFKFGYLVESGLWQGNQTDLDEIFRKIDSGKIELSDIFSKGKLDFIIKFMNGFYDRYGLSLPEMTEMKTYGKDVVVTDLDRILSSGKLQLDKLKESKDILKGSILINLQSIFDLDNQKFPDDKELIFEKLLKTLSEDIESGKLELTGEQLKKELSKMSDGYLPSFAIKEILTKHQDFGIKIDSLNSLNASNVVNFLQKVETGKWHGTIDDLNKIVEILNAGGEVLEKIYGENIDAKITEINTKGSELANKNIINVKYGLYENSKLNMAILDEYFNIAKIYSNFTGNQLTNNGMASFKDKLSKGINYTAEDFFKELNIVLNSNIDINDSINSNNFSIGLKNIVITEINNYLSDFDNKSYAEKKDIIKNLKSKLGDLTKFKELFGQESIEVIVKIQEIENIDKKLKENELKEMDKKLDDFTKNIEENVKTRKLLTDSIDLINGLSQKNSDTELKDLWNDLYKKGVLKEGLPLIQGTNLLNKLKDKISEINIKIDVIDTKIIKFYNDLDIPLHDLPKATRDIISETIKNKQKEISNILKPLQLELISRGEILKSLEIVSILDKIHTNAGFNDFLNSNSGVLDFNEHFSKEYNEGKNIRTLSELEEIFKNIDYTKLPRGINNYNDLIGKIHSSTNTRTLKAIENSIKSLNITR